MTWRINGCGTTMSPQPAEGEFCLSIHWLTFIFIPLIPLGCQIIEGGKGDKYSIHKKITWKEAIHEFGVKGICKTIAHAYFMAGAILATFYILSLAIGYFDNNKTSTSPKISNAPYTQVLNADELYGKVEKSVYSIVSGDYRGGAVAITDEILVTNCHLLTHSRVIRVNDQRKLLQIISAEYKDIDLCFIYVPNMNLTPVHIRSSADIKIGAAVYAVGNPKGYNKTISRGIVSNKDNQDRGSFLQTDAAISPGSSGGGLFDDKANLIGITSKIANGGNGIGFAAPTEPIIKIIAKLQKTSTDKFKYDANNFDQMITILDRYDDHDEAKFREELALCANKGNYDCISLLADIYYEKGWYSLAYPLLLKSSGIEGSSADYYLGTMFKKGLGVSKDYDKAWYYLKKSALLGDAQAARDIGYIYVNLILDEKNGSQKSDQLQDNLANGYAWLKVSEALGEQNYTYKGDEGPISDLIQILETYLDKEDKTLNSANKLASEICSKIDRCVL